MVEPEPNAHGFRFGSAGRYLWAMTGGGSFASM